MLVEFLLSAAVMGGIAGVLTLVLIFSERYIANYGECHVNINDDDETSFTVDGGGEPALRLGRKEDLHSVGVRGSGDLRVLQGPGSGRRRRSPPD